MIEFAKITGDTDNNLVEVRMRTGECLYAPVAVVGTDVTAPSAEWITAHKDEFLALVAFEKGLLMNPILVGFYPVKGADSSKYNTTEKLIALLEKLLQQLQKARVNTQIGPQQFMPDTLMVLEQLSADLAEAKKDINQLKL